MCNIDPQLKKRIVAEHDDVGSYDELPQVVRNNIEAGLTADIEPFDILEGR